MVESRYEVLIEIWNEDFRVCLNILQSMTNIDKNNQCNILNRCKTDTFPRSEIDTLTGRVIDDEFVYRINGVTNLNE